jgi:hypothetical protein
VAGGRDPGTGTNQRADEGISETGEEAQGVELAVEVAVGVFEEFAAARTTSGR